MNRDPVLIRVDASLEKGYERLARCQMFAAALQRRRRPVHFISQLEPRSLALNVKRGGNSWLEADYPAGTPDDLKDLRREIYRLQPAAVVLDDADIPQEYLAELVSTGILVVSFDHQGMVHFPSHLVVNPLLGPTREGYEFDPGTQLLLGRRYAFVRPEMRRCRPGRSQEPAPLQSPNSKLATGNLYRALLALGDDDRNQHVIELAKLLLTVPKLGKIDIVVRHEHPQIDAIRDLVEAHKDRLELALEPAEISARVTRCHFAVTSGSGWSLELACVGVPQLVVVQNESHWPNAQRLEEEGCATCLGWHESVSAQTVRVAVQNLIADPHDRQAMSRCGRKLIDGRGPDRLITALEIMLHPSRQARLKYHAA